MSIPVSFVFKLPAVLTRNDALFSAGNVQRSANAFLSGDTEFNKLDFNAIYHDSWLNPDNRDYICDCRMAEVAIRNRLHLQDALQAIVFRTKWDLLTFRYHLALHKTQCNYPMAIEQIAGSIFLRKGLFLTDAAFIDNQIDVSFHFPDLNAPTDRRYHVYVHQKCASSKLLFDQEIELTTPNLSISNFKPDAESVWTIKLENELAFEGTLKHAKSEIFG